MVGIRAVKVMLRTRIAYLSHLYRVVGMVNVNYEISTTIDIAIAKCTVNSFRNLKSLLSTVFMPQMYTTVTLSLCCIPGVIDKPN